MKSKLIVSVALLSLLLSVGAAVDFRSHTIEIRINEDSSANVKETFAFSVSQTNIMDNHNVTEQDFFNTLVSEADKDFDKLTELSPDVEVAPSILGDKENLAVSTSETYRTHELIISYQTDELIDLDKSEGRVSYYKFDTDLLKFYDEDSEMVKLPDNTNLLVSLPNSLDEDRVDPPKDIWLEHGGYEYLWTTGMWNIDMSYSLVDPITGWSPKGIGEAFGKVFIGQPIYGALLIILIILSVIYRKQIKLLFSEGLTVDEEPERPKEQL
ncbi:MAG: hypothetical protein ACOCTT_01865 [archaeon]